MRIISSLVESIYLILLVQVGHSVIVPYLLLLVPVGLV